MNCMKCGVQIDDDQVFCPDCLKIMAQNPVVPGTPVHIPKRPARQPDKKPREIKPQVQIAALKRRIRWLSGIIALLVILAALLAAALYFQVHTPQPQPQPVTGRNYTIAPR